MNLVMTFLWWVPIRFSDENISLRIVWPVSEMSAIDRQTVCAKLKCNRDFILSQAQRKQKPAVENGGKLRSTAHSVLESIHTNPNSHWYITVIYCAFSFTLKVSEVFGTHIIVIKTNIENVSFSILLEESSWICLWTPEHMWAFYSAPIAWHASYLPLPILLRS